jgi:hypothetical protein
MYLRLRMTSVVYRRTLVKYVFQTYRSFIRERHLVTVAFLRLPIVEKYIQAGRNWWIYEAPRLVAEGEIISLQDLKNQWGDKKRGGLHGIPSRYGQSCWLEIARVVI